MTLKTKKEVRVASAVRAAAAPQSGFAYVVAGGRTGSLILVIDLAKGAAVAEIDARNFRLFGLDKPVLSADGKVLAVTAMSNVHFFSVDGAKLKLIGSTPGVISGAFVGPAISDDGKYAAAPSGGGNSGGSRPYSVQVFETGNPSAPAAVLEFGAYPTTIAFDLGRGRIYGHNMENDVIVFDRKGVARQKFAFGGRGNGPSWTLQILAHPDGRSLVVLKKPLGGGEASLLWQVPLAPKE